MRKLTRVQTEIIGIISNRGGVVPSISYISQEIDRDYKRVRNCVKILEGLGVLKVLQVPGFGHIISIPVTPPREKSQPITNNPLKVNHG